MYFALLLYLLIVACRLEQASEVMGNANNNEEIADQTVNEEIERVVTEPKVTDYVELEASATDQDKHGNTVVSLWIQPKGRFRATQIEGIKTTFDDIGSYNQPICDTSAFKVFESCGEYKDFAIFEEGGFGEYVPSSRNFYKARGATISYPVEILSLDNELEVTVQLKLRDGNVIDAEPITVVSYPAPEESSRPDARVRANSQQGEKTNSYAGIEFIHSSQQDNSDGVARTLVRLTAKKSISEGSKLHLKLPYRYAVESYEGRFVKHAQILNSKHKGTTFGSHGQFIGEKGFETLWFNGEEVIEFKFKELHLGDMIQMYFALDIDNPRSSDGGQPRASFAPNGDFTGDGSKSFGRSFNHPIDATLEGCTADKLAELSQHFLSSQEKQQNNGKLRLVDNVQLRQGASGTITIQNPSAFSTGGGILVSVGANGGASAVKFGGNDSEKISSLIGTIPLLRDVWSFDPGARKYFQTNTLNLTIGVNPKKSFKITVSRPDPEPRKLGELFFKVAPSQSCWH